MRTRTKTTNPASRGVRGLLSASGRERRGGFLSMELVMTLPLLFVVILAAVQFSMLFMARGDLVDACRVGARLASQPGVRSDDVESRVRDLLQPRFRSVANVYVDKGERSGDVVQVAVSIPMRAAAPDVLWPIGIGLAGRDLTASTRVIHE